jgi:hypothetical protein
VSLDDALDDGKSQPRTPAVGLACLPEPVEQLREVVCGDARTRVGYPEKDFPLSRSCSDRDPSAGPCELARISDEVLEYLEQPVPVGPDLRKLRRHVEPKLDRPGRFERLPCLHGIQDDLPGAHTGTF